MTLITFQDGAVVMRDGKVGTEQDCCCEQPPCECFPRFSTPPVECEIDYIGFQVTFTTTACGGQNITQPFQLNEANGYFESFGPLGANGCEYTILAQAFCFGDRYILDISISAAGFVLCDDPGSFLIGVSFFIPFSMSVDTSPCCPVGTELYEYAGTADGTITTDCLGMTVTVTPVTIVKL
jgi:hypothetical protein